MSKPALPTSHGTVPAKRQSLPSHPGPGITKRARSLDHASVSETSGTADTNSANKSSGGHAIDPEDLSDALLSAGVDLKAEEILLTRTLPVTFNDSETGNRLGDRSNYYVLPGAHENVAEFLESRNLQGVVQRVSAEAGIKGSVDKENEILSLISLSCEEWLAGIVTSAVIFSRHRRRSNNNAHSDLAKALRSIAVADKEMEERWHARKAILGLDSESVSGGKRLGVEEAQHRATNATASMMTSGKKKYSWLSGGGSSSTPGKSGAGISTGSENHIRIREAREEPGIVLRDVLGVLEERRMGVEKALIKGYCKQRS